MRQGLAACCALLCLACDSVEGPLLHAVELGDPDGGHDAGELPALPIAQDMTWQYQLSGTVELGLDVQLFVIDLFDTDADELDALHASGKLAVAYLSAGTVESYRPDAGDFPRAAVGNTHPSYPQEAWLDVRDEGVREVMAARLELAQRKGFDGVVPTNLSGYRSDTGFALSAGDVLAYSKWLTQQAHARGLYAGMTDDFEQAGQLADAFDWAIHFGCVERDDCDELQPFVARGKPVFDVETSGDSAQICEAAAEQGLNVLIKRPQFDAYRMGCL